jgi:hypothetical protein
VAGWQTGYAFDFNRGVPNAASDTVGQRQQFLASAAALRTDYGQLSQSSLLTTSERDLLSGSWSRASPASVRDRNLCKCVGSSPRPDICTAATVRSPAAKTGTPSSELISAANGGRFGMTRVNR